MSAYLTDADLAEQFGRSREFVQRMCRTKQWPHMKVGKSYRFKAHHVAAIEALCDVQATAPVDPGLTWDLAPGRRQP